MKKALCLSILLVLAASVAGVSSDSVRIRGTIINVSDSSIEIKKGRTEVELYWADDSKVSLLGTAADRGAAAICQKVEAVYAEKDGKSVIVSLDILQESYCTK
ncbi:MAG: hypothetical protein KBC90_14005 [Spirochaetes bacterium]|nr:hypothetical protein [Spirochaetota bacterium]HOD16182.1 hypothetical protein [Spirochaetota bacterium]